MVFGLARASAPDPFLVGLAVLGLLSETAAERPLLCVVDDAQWLDRASALTLAFAARRLLADRVGLVFGARVVDEALRGLPELEVRGLDVQDARALLKSAVRFPLGLQVRDRIVAETGGNPLALLELPRGLTAAQLAGGFGLPDAQALPGRIEESFARRLEALPEQTRRLLLLAAAEPVGDPLLVWRAAERLGVSVAATIDPDTDGLLTLAEQVTFRHPLVRSAVYRSARRPENAGACIRRWRRSATPRQIRIGAPGIVHGRRWAPTRRSLPSSSAPPAARRRAGGLAAAAFLERAVALTDVPARRARAGRRPGQAPLPGRRTPRWDLWRSPRRGRPTRSGGHADLLRGQIALSQSRVSDAPPLLLKAARRLESLDPGLARETYLEAWGAAQFAGRLAPAALLDGLPRRGALPRRRRIAAARTSCSMGSRCGSPRACRSGVTALARDGSSATAIR